MDDLLGDATHDSARAVFAGLVPRVEVISPTEPTHPDRTRLTRSVLATLPVVLIGSMAAMTLNLSGTVDAVNAKPAKPKGAASELGKTLRDAISSANTAIRNGTAARLSTASVPVLYTVRAGDTVSDVAVRYGLSTASVLALNGLSWSSLIFPGQSLKLTNGTAVVPAAPATTPSTSGRYTIAAGDTISAIAHRFGISTLSILTANGLGWSSIIYPGQTVAIPGRTVPVAPASAPVEELPASQDPTTTDPEVAVPASDVAAEPPADAPQAVAPAPSADPAPAPSEPAPAPAGTTYTIVSGDTISSIAARFGITTQMLLDANGLSSSSVIYSGRTLVVPGVTTASTGGTVTILNDEMRGNAEVIIEVGRELGVSDYGIVIALAAAMQESSLRNISWGDLDSVGLFQQRPSSGWGTVAELTTPSYAARLFYGGPSNPNAGLTRGLLDISGWQSMSVTKAAQAVQISAYPDAYAKWEASARSWLAQLG